MTPVIVLSSSRAAFGMNISAPELRAKYVEVNDLLEAVEGAYDVKKKAIDIAMSAIGNRLVHLHTITEGIGES